MRSQFFLIIYFLIQKLSYIIFYIHTLDIGDKLFNPELSSINFIASIFSADSIGFSLGSKKVTILVKKNEKLIINILFQNIKIK